MILNPAAIVAVAGTAVGLLMAAFALGVSRSPFWAERRQFAFVAATSAGYCAFDAAMVLDLPATTIAMMVQIALAFGVLHGLSWIRYLAAMDARAFTTAERWITRIGVAIAVAGFVPGLLVTEDLYTFRVDWLDVTYRTPQPTLVGVLCYVFFAAALVVVVVNLRHRWHEGWPRRLPLAGVVVLAVLAANDTLTSVGALRTPLLLDVGTVVIVLAVCAMHERRFAARAHRLECASVELQREVAARTEALLDAQSALAANQRLAGLGRLTAGVAHEINHPLTTVQEDLERLRALARTDAGAHPEVSNYVEHALRATQQIARVIRRLRDAGRATTSDAAHVEPFLVAPVIRETLASIGARVSSMPSVIVDVDSTLSAVGNAGLVGHALEHLLVNAAQALEGGRGNARIQVRAQRQGDRVRIVVADNGPGISVSVFSRLFEPFVSTKPVGIASGLGLAVSQGLMRSQKGSVELVQTSSFGTQMSLELPWGPCDPVVMPGAVAQPPRTGRITLLVIDDDADVRKVLYSTAKDSFDVVVAESIAQARARLEAGWRPDVVLCDLMMPDGGADTWFTLCSTSYPMLAARTIIITAGPTTPKSQALIAAHGSRVLLKPFSTEDMYRIVGEVTG